MFVNPTRALYYYIVSCFKAIVDIEVFDYREADAVDIEILRPDGEYDDMDVNFTT